MNKYLIGAIAVVALVAAFFGGQATAPKSLGSYVPPTQSYQGFTQSISVSSTLPVTSFCSPSNIQIIGGAAVTLTVPTATSMFAACPGLNNFGASVTGNIVNDSTNTATFAAGTGDVYKCETIGAGSSTVQGTCTATGFTLLASSTVNYQVSFDSASSTFIFMVGNNYK